MLFSKAGHHKTNTHKNPDVTQTDEDLLGDATPQAEAVVASEAASVHFFFENRAKRDENEGRGAEKRGAHAHLPTRRRDAQGGPTT